MSKDQNTVQCAHGRGFNCRTCYPRFHVIVGNVGTVHTGNDETSARRVFAEYVSASRDGIGRAAGESVSVFDSVYSEIVCEHVGVNDEGDDE